MKKIFILSLVVLMLCIFAFSGLVGAAAEKIGDAYKPSMNINFAGIENPEPIKINGVEKPSVVNVKDTNYIHSRLVELLGGTATYDGKTAVYTLPNMGNNDKCSAASKAVTYLFKQNKQVGNGFFPTELGGTEFVISKNAWNQSHIIKDYKGDIIPINPVPVKITDRLVWLKTNGYKSPYTLPIATTEPKSGDASNLITSINCIPNMINYSTIKDYYDFNVFTTGDKRYLRTYNNSEQSCEGSPTVNENCEVIGVYMLRGANYSLFVDLDDLRGFLNLN